MSDIGQRLNKWAHDESLRRAKVEERILEVALHGGVAAVRVMWPDEWGNFADPMRILRGPTWRQRRKMRRIVKATEVNRRMGGRP